MRSRSTIILDAMTAMATVVGTEPPNRFRPPEGIDGTCPEILVVDELPQHVMVLENPELIPVLGPVFYTECRPGPPRQDWKQRERPRKRSRRR